MKNQRKAEKGRTKRGKGEEMKGRSGAEAAVRPVVTGQFHKSEQFMKSQTNDVL
jgi:hypothetical protein